MVIVFFVVEVFDWVWIMWFDVLIVDYYLDDGMGIEVVSCV